MRKIRLQTRYTMRRSSRLSLPFSAPCYPATDLCYLRRNSAKDSLHEASAATGAQPPPTPCTGAAQRRLARLGSARAAAGAIVHHLRCRYVLPPLPHTHTPAGHTPTHPTHPTPHHHTPVEQLDRRDNVDRVLEPLHKALIPRLRRLLRDAPPRHHGPTQLPTTTKWWRSTPCQWKKNARRQTILLLSSKSDLLRAPLPPPLCHGPAVDAQRCCTSRGSCHGARRAR